jgi:hypothetical protein
MRTQRERKTREEGKYQSSQRQMGHSKVVIWNVSNET